MNRLGKYHEKNKCFTHEKTNEETNGKTNEIFTGISVAILMFFNH